MKPADRVTATIDVAVDPATAFQIFTEKIDQWWERGPRNFYDSKRAVAMRFEPGPGGRYLEVYGDAPGEALEIGRITLWEPGSRLVWRCSLDDTEVDIRFEAISGGTRVSIEQRIVPGGTTAHFYTGWPNILVWFGSWTGRRSEPPAALTAAQVAERLGLDGAQAPWLLKLEEAGPSVSMPTLSPESLPPLLARLQVSPEDVAELLRTLPSPTHGPEEWWLLERSRHMLACGLANRDDNAEPLPPLPSSLALFPAHLILVTLDAIRQCHQEFGIPDDISWETLSHLGQAMAAYCKLHGQAGIHVTRWDWLRFAGWLYQVGRLEVTPYRLRKYPKEAGPLFWYDDETAQRLGPGFRTGDPALGLHVPATDPLTAEACDESLRRIRKGFENRYPGEPPRIATCTSWLLDDQLAEYLSPDSNILAFQRRFQVVPGARDNDEAVLWFVFGGDRPKGLEALPQRTTLERAVVQHLRQGRHWKMRTGWLKLIE